MVDIVAMAQHLLIILELVLNPQNQSLGRLLHANLNVTTMKIVYKKMKNVVTTVVG